MGECVADKNFTRMGSRRNSGHSAASSGWSAVVTVMLAALLGLVAPSSHADAQQGSNAIQVFGSDVVRTLAMPGVSANVNFFTDDDALLQPATPLHESLNRMGTGLLRFPGGEKSDNYLWSVPPYAAADPHFAVTGSANCAYTYRRDSIRGRYADAAFAKPVDWTLDFDEYMTVIEQTGAEPFITVAGDAHRHVGSCAAPTLETLVENAAEWVRYANITNDFGIELWMVGNESWNQSAHAASPPTATEYVEDFIAIASAMKTVDPTITIVANTQGGEWVDALIDDPVAAALTDAVGISSYAGVINGWPGYQTNQVDLDGPVSWLLGSMRARGSTLPVFVYEYSPIDFSRTWESFNDLGHALATLDMYGAIMSNPEVADAALWNTRWFPSAEPGWRPAADRESLFTAIDTEGELGANALALSLWGSRRHDSLLRVQVPAQAQQSLSAYATASADGSEAAIYLINRSDKPTAAQIDLVGLAADDGGSVSTTVLRGNSATDVSPEIVIDELDIRRSGSSLTATFAPRSISVIDIGEQVGVGVRATVTQTCVARDGRFVVDLTNLGSTNETVEVLTTRIGTYAGVQLPEQVISVPAGTTRQTVVASRADGLYRVRTQSSDPMHTAIDVLAVDCDNPPTPPNVSVGVSCLAENGRVDVNVTNDSPITESFAITVGSLRTRERNVPGNETGRVTTTGRADGPLQVRVARTSNSATPEFTTTVNVNCDAPMLVATPRIMVSCLAGNGRVDIWVMNPGPDAAIYAVAFGALDTRRARVEVGESQRFTITGRPDGNHVLAVRRSGYTLATAVVPVACDG